MSSKQSVLQHVLWSDSSWSMWMQSFPALHLSTVFRMGAEMVQRYSQEPWANFYSGSGRFGSGACAVHESLSVCSMCRITGSKCQKNMLNTFTIYCKSRAFAGAVASTCWHSWADRKQEHRIKPFDSKVYQSRIAARYDTGSNQQPNFSTIYC